jgi:prophage regulatory protein
MPPKPKAKKDARRAADLLGDNAGYLRLDDVLTVFPIGARSWYRGIREGRYPPGALLAPRTRAWKVADIKKLLDGDDAA